MFCLVFNYSNSELTDKRYKQESYKTDIKILPNPYWALNNPAQSANINYMYRPVTNNLPREKTSTSHSWRT